MNRDLLLFKSLRIELPSLNEEAEAELNKGWSFSYVYYLRELRDIFLLIEKHGYGSQSSLLSKCKEEISPEGDSGWTERGILERLNALKNFGLISANGELIKPNIFQSQFNEDLSNEDKRVFKNIFFSYFRFREIISWMIDPYQENRIALMSQIDEKNTTENSKVMFSFISEGRFTDSFFFELKDNADIFCIDRTNSDLMRFWDVFVKWGVTLDLIDRFQLKWADINVLPKVKSLSCVYFRQEIPPNFSVIEYIRKNYKSDYIYIPQLILQIIMSYRFSLQSIKDLIVSESTKNRELISMQRTSEIFIEDKEKILLPMYKNTYISHLLML